MVAFDWVVDTSLPVMNIVTPRNVNMSGIFGRSFAYFTIKERLPIIITKIIDHLSRDRDSISAVYGKIAYDDIKQVIGYLSKLKNEIQTNKTIVPLSSIGDDFAKWNRIIDEHREPHYFTAIWLFTECYVYRRIKEAFLETNSLKQFDPFQLQKNATVDHSLEAMCLVADHLVKNISDDENNKENFIRLLKMTLWGNKCDLSLSAGEDVSQSTNPMKMVDLWSDNLIVDHTEDVYNDLCNSNDGEIIDIVCDNAGYELYMDLCFADFLISKKFANKIRFHVKAIPWFVSDVLMHDFSWTLDKLSTVSFEKEISDKFRLDSQNLNAVASKWKAYVAEGIWTYQADGFWTLPHEFYKMKYEDKDLYRSLGDAKMIFFKGDLNYRKLMGEMNWPPTTPFNDALREFFPGPLVAVRTVKADLISGLPPGKMEELNAIDDKWMEKGDYGVIQYCSKKMPIS